MAEVNFKEVYYVLQFPDVDKPLKSGSGRCVSQQEANKYVLHDKASWRGSYRTLPVNLLVATFFASSEEASSFKEASGMPNLIVRKVCIEYSVE